MPPMPAEAEAPPDLVTPFTAKPACSARRAIVSSCSNVRQRGIEQIEIGKIARQQSGIRQPGERVLGRDARHRHGALGQRRDAVARDVVGRNHRLTLADQHAQAHVVAFGALGFLDRAVANLDRRRDAAHRHRVGGIGAGRARGLHQSLGKRGQGGLVEQGIHLRELRFRGRIGG